MGALAALAALARSDAHATPDASWLLYASGRLLDGARLGEDVVDAVPPLIIWLKTPVVLFSRTLGLSPWTTWVFAMCLLGLGTLWCGEQVLRRDEEWSKPWTRGWFLVLAAAALLLAPRNDFGQREQVALFLTFPYVLLLGARVRGQALPWGLAVGTGAAAGIGMSIKPHFALLLPAALLLLRFRTGRPILQSAALPEQRSALAVGGLCVAAVFLVAPTWVRYAAEYWPLYAGYLAVNPLGVALTGPGAGISILALLAVLVLGPHMQARRATAEALLTGTLAFHLAAVAQAKGFPYHSLPALILGLLSLAVVWSGLRRPLPRLARPLYAASAAAAVMTLIALGTRDAVFQLAGHPVSRGDIDRSLDLIVPVIRERFGSPTIAVLSSNIASGFPLVMETGATWTSRHSGLWMLAAFYDKQLFSRHMVRTRPPAERPVLERRFVDEVYQDLERRVPDLILVPRPDPSFEGWGGALQFNYLEYFTAEPRFREFLSRYRDIGTIGNYQAFTSRSGAGTDSRPPVIADPPVGAPGPAPGLKLRIKPAVVLLFTLFFTVALVVELRPRRAATERA